ncbi:MAG: hypothetical protein WC307_03145 [Candidatus Nanoarchaeia archaeon]|jgi:hypothetical protein
MNKQTKRGLLIGLIAGIIDVIPMLLQGLTWDANLSAFSMWLVIGFLLPNINLGVKGVKKGLIVSFLVLLPNLFIIGWGEPISLIPIGVMTLLLGSLVGYLIDKK